MALAYNSCIANSKPHPFIDEFFTIHKADGGICYTYPQHLACG